MAATLFAMFATSLACAQEGAAIADQQDREALPSTSLPTTDPAEASAAESQQTGASQNQQGVAGASQPTDHNQAQSDRTDKERQNIEHEESSGTSKDRLFWLLPNFETIEEADKVPPLTVGQKFGTTARGLIDPSEFGLMTIIAGLEQASDSIPEYGQGFEGYGKRYITAYADNAVENFMANAILPSLLHQDPRYYQLGHGGFARRTFHAFSRLFITRTDSGKEQFNYSEVFGAGMAAAISDYGYHPASDQSLGNVAGVWGTQMGWDLTTYILKEFWPDLRKKYERRHNAQQQ